MNFSKLFERKKNEKNHARTYLLFSRIFHFLHKKLKFKEFNDKKNQYKEGDCQKTGAWKVCRFKGGLTRKRGVDTPMHTMCKC